MPTKFTVTLAFVWMVSIAAGLIAVAAAEDQPDRLAIPGKSDVADAVSIIRQAFEDDYRTAKETGNPRPLLEKLMGSIEATENPARKYGMLLEAERLAAESDDDGLALHVTATRAELFAIDGLKARLEMLSAMGHAGRATTELLDSASGLADEAIRADRFDVATAAADLAVEVANSFAKDEKKRAMSLKRKTRGKEQLPELEGPRIVEQAEHLQRQIKAGVSLGEAFLTAKQTLASSPDDPAASAVAGTYLCFVKDDWESGLEFLSKASEGELKTLAVRERSAVVGPDGRDVEKPDPKALMPIADAWWELADGDVLQTVGEKAAVRAHAADLYERILPKLADPLDVKLAEKRIAAVPEADRIGPAAQPIVVTEVFLSDLPEIDPVVSYGTYGKNGQTGFDGLTITVNGEASPKGISMHPASHGDSRVTYAVPKGAKTLLAHAAINDTGRRRTSSLQFKVLGDDGTVLWQGPRTLQGRGESMPVEVNVAGRKTIQLMTECSGFNGSAHAVWLEPRFVVESSGKKRTANVSRTAPASSPSSGLSDLLDDDAPKASDSKGRSRRLRRMTVPRDAIRFQGHSYYFFTVQCSAQEAAQQCDNAGGHLARIDSDEEYDMIMKVLQTVRQLQRADEMRAWIDGSDKAAEGQWVYADGTPMTYFRWGPGEPNNSDNEDFVELLLRPRDDFQAMNDLSEGHRAGFVCEWEK